MTRSELIEHLTARFPTFTLQDTKACVDELIEAITEALAADDRVEVRGFGSFQLNHRKARIGRNPKSGEKVNVPAKAVPHFKAGKELREKVDKP
jgi:integration host factor subunit beta